MKRIVLNKFHLFAAAFCFFISSCAPLAISPSIEYLGDTYSPSKSIDVFYEARQIKKKYRIMGRVTRETIFKSEKTRMHMIELAKGKGADGIIFLDFESKINETSRYSIIKAELIKYQD